MSSKEYTVEEVRAKFLTHVNDMVYYWDSLPNKDSHEKLEGLAFSIMAALDGCSMDLPGFIVAPCPHEDDKEYAIEQGDNYYPYNDGENVVCDIGGGLHELLSNYRR